MELTASMDERVKQVFQVFQAAKDPRDQTVCKESMGRKETLDHTERKERKEKPVKRADQEGLGTTAPTGQREIEDPEAQMGRKEREVTMVLLELMERKADRET